MKTYNGWRRSERDLSEYLSPGDRIDEALYNHLGEVVPPLFCYDGFVQCGDCDRETEGDALSHDRELSRRSLPLSGHPPAIFK